MCEYCNQVGLNNDLKHYSASDNTCNVRVYNWYTTDIHTLEVQSQLEINDVIIKYCPMCGRYLKED